MLSSPSSDGFDAEVLSETTEVIRKVIVNIYYCSYTQDSQPNPPQSLDALLVSPTTQFVNAVSTC